MRAVYGVVTVDIIIIRLVDFRMYAVTVIIPGVHAITAVPLVQMPVHAAVVMSEMESPAERLHQTVSRPVSVAPSAHRRYAKEHIKITQNQPSVARGSFVRHQPGACAWKVLYIMITGAGPDITALPHRSRHPR